MGVLRCLGVEKHFPSVFDITLTRYIPKPNPEPYHQVLDTLCIAGEKCMMIEDMPANLQPAKELGMTTVLVGANGQGKTNILEAISYLSLTKSFYASSDATAVRFGTEGFEVEGAIVAGSGLQYRVRVAFEVRGGEKQFSVNNTRPDSLASVIGTFPG